MTREGRLLCVPVVLAALSARAAAQPPSVELTLESSTLEVGEVVDVQVQCLNTGVPSPPQITAPAGLKLELANATPSSSSFMQIINGRKSQRTTYTYYLRLTALQEGTFTLGPASVEADGKTYRSQPVPIVVRRTKTEAMPRGDRFLFAEIEVRPKSLYVTETFIATLTIGILKVEIDGRVFDIDLLRHVLDQGSSQFSVFADGSVRRSEQWLEDSTGTGHRYELFHVTKEVRAEEVGEFTVGPVFLKAGYPTRIRRGFFGGYEITETRRETARADAVTVNIKGPPEEGRPASYTGAMGTFSLDVSAKPLRVEQGRPITLSIAISGTPLDGVAGPDLANQAELASRFAFSTDELIGDVEGGAKIFRRAIFPRQTGEQTIPAIEWSYFDPRTERYVTLTSQPIAITVNPAAPGASTVDVFDTQATKREGTSLTVLTGGIAPNYVDPDSVLADQAFSLTPAWGAALIIAPVVWLAVSLLARRRARLRADPALARRYRAYRRARAQIGRLEHDGDPRHRLQAAAESLVIYLSDRFCLPGASLTPQEAGQALSRRRVDPRTTAEIVQFLETCDALRFASAPADTATAARAAASVTDWIDRIERQSRR